MKQLLITENTDFQGSEKQPNIFRKQVLRYGRWIHPANSSKFFEVTRDFAEKMVANFKANIIEHVPLLNGGHDVAPDANKGTVTALSAEDDGVYATVDFGKDDNLSDLAREKKIHGVSAQIDPDYLHKETGKKIGPLFQHLALVQNPYIKNMRGFEQVMLANKEVADILEFSDTENEMLTKEQLIAALKEQGIDVAKLQEDSKTVTSLSEKVTTLSKELDALKAAGVKPDERYTEVTKKLELTETDSKSKDAKIVELSDAVKSLQKDSKHIAATTKVEALVRDGKILPADKETYIELAEENEARFDKLAKTLPVRIDFKEKGSAPSGKEVGDGVNLSEEDAQKEAARLAEKYGYTKKVK